MSAFVDSVLRRALSQDGVRETAGSNAGPQVNEYLRAVGLPPGNPWCAAFVYWSVSEEAKARQIEPPFLRSGYCPTIHQWAKDAGILHTTPQRGDAFLVLRDYPEGRFASHIGLVASVSSGRYATIEGNTNGGGSADGDGVYQRSRPNDNRSVFIRWGRLLPAAVTDPATFSLVVNGKAIANMPVVGGRSLCPLRAWADHWGLAIEWDAETQTVSLAGRPVAAPVSLIGGASYAPISALIQGTGLRSVVDTAARTVTLTGAL